LIAGGSPTRLLRDTARAEGMTTLRQAGLRAVCEGETTVDEVLLYT
jgi:type II secretory ATPase GspE/PulE/Tfp pilus assembly ATPase PilB-like protein